MCACVCVEVIFKRFGSTHIAAHIRNSAFKYSKCKTKVQDTKSTSIFEFRWL